jgi:hypothetical protein
MFEEAAAPSSKATQAHGIGNRDMLGHGTDGCMRDLHGEAHFVGLASAAVNASAAPKQHARHDVAECAPIIVDLNQCLRAAPAQDELKKLRGITRRDGIAHP